MDRPRATVVVPIFNEAPSVAPLAERLGKVLEAQNLEWDVLFVDDGSSDETYDEIAKLHASDGRFKCLRFARNFGAHIATSAGLAHAGGDLAILITSDLEEPPEAIPDFLEKWREGYHVVWGIRAKRATRGLSNVGARLYHRVFAWLAAQGPGQAEIGGGYFLADARVLRAVRSFSERNRNIIGLILWAGFKQTRITYEPAQRRFGRSKWSLGRKIALALDTFVGFSNRPLRVVFGAGFVALTVALVALGISIAIGNRSAADCRAGVGIGALVAAVAGIVGFQFVVSGLLGEYLWRALDEARRRPLYVVMDRLGIEDRGPEPH